MFELIKQEPVIFLFRKMWKYATGHKHLVVYYLLLALVANLVLLLQPWLYGLILNEVQINGFGGHNINYLILLLFSLLGTEIIFWMFWGPSRYFETMGAFKTNVNYKKYLLRGTLGLGLSWHSDKDSGDTIDKFSKASEGLFRFSQNSFMMVSAIIRIVGSTVILFTYDFNITVLALLILVVSLSVIFKFDATLVPQYKKLNLFDNRAYARVFDTISNIVTVKVLHIENPVAQNIYKAWLEPYELYRKNRILVEYKWGVGSVLFSLLVVLPLSWYLYSIYKNNLILEIGTFSALYLYLSRLNDVFMTFASTYEDMIVNKSRVKNAENVEADIDRNKNIDRKKVPVWDKIHLKDVHFKYDTEIDVPTVNNINFSFYKGEKIAFIGESGSGKTTFLKILHGLYQDVTAQIVIENKGKEVKSQSTNFANIDLKTTLVPQEPEVFSASIKENITLAVDFKEEDIQTANDLAEFTPVASLLPKGLDSVVNEKGVNLSGGQKQRLALARALLFAKNKEIILLDESTSSVDPENEVKIYHNIFEHFTGKTILASIHKMNLLKYFDRIVIMEKGNIVDQGSFDELLKTNSNFRNSWEEYIKNSEDTSKKAHFRTSV